MLEKMAYALPFLWDGFTITLFVSAVVVAVSLVVGCVLGLALVHGPAVIAWPVRVFADVVRGIPILVLLFFVYYGLPAAGLNLQPLTAAIVGLTLFKTAQTIEYVRGAVESLPRGQTDAAKAIGLRYGQRFLWVIAPQALRRFLPPWINGVTDAVKGSALVSLLGVTELMRAMQQVIGRTYDPMPVYVLGALIYFAINYALSSASRALERRYAHFRE